MTDPKIIAFIKKEIKERVSRREDKTAKSLGFGGPTLFVFWGHIENGKVVGRMMEQNFEFANIGYSKYGFMEYAKLRLAVGDAYAVIKLEDNTEPKLLMIKKSGI